MANKNQQMQSREEIRDLSLRHPQIAMLEVLLDMRDQNERILAKLDEIYMAVPDDSSLRTVLNDLGIGECVCQECVNVKPCDTCGKER